MVVLVSTSHKLRIIAKKHYANGHAPLPLKSGPFQNKTILEAINGSYSEV